MRLMMIEKEQQKSFWFEECETIYSVYEIKTKQNTDKNER